MKRNLLNLFMFLAVAAVSFSVTSCKDYDEDKYFEMKQDFQSQVDAMDKLIEDLQNQCNCLVNGQLSRELQDALLAYLDAHKDEWKGDKGDKGDTGAQGEKGDKGDQGEQGIQGEKGDKGDQGEQGIQGEKGDKGDQGEQGIQGEKGDKGDNGYTPYIGENGNWWINGEDLNVPAKGQDGKDVDPETLAKILQDIIDAQIEIENLKDAIEQTNLYINGLQAQVNAINALDLDNRVKANEAAIAAAQETLKELKARVAALENKLAHLITNITLNGSRNSVFGSLNMPTNTQTNIIAAWYGEIGSMTDAMGNDVMFPALSGAKENKSLETLTGDGNNTIVGNAGKLYLTINPTNVDFTGTKFELVASNGESSPFVLDNIKPSTDKLTFGYTRAAVESNSSNGFYEATAHISKHNIGAAKPNINFGELAREAKDAIKNAINGKFGAINLTQLKKVIINNTSDILDAYAIKAEWQENKADGSKVTNAVYSNYGIAATTLPALDYTLGENFNYQHVPGYNRALDYINRFNGKLKDWISKAFNQSDLNTLKNDIKNIHINNVSVEPLSDATKAQFVIDLNVTKDLAEALNGKTITITDENGEATTGTIALNGDTEITITYTKDLTSAIEEIYGNIEEAMGDVNDMLEAIRTALDDVNEILDKMDEYESNLDGKVDNVTDRVISYLDKINNKIVNLINSINARILPVIIVENGNKAFQAWGVQNQPQKVTSNNVKAIMTSQTAEILVPAWKKYFIVYNEAGAVIADSGILDGDKAEFSFTLPGDGKYKMVYKAIDYKGNVRECVRWIKK